MKPALARSLLWRLGAVVTFCGVPALLLGLALSNLADVGLASEQAADKRAATARILAQLEKHRSRVGTPVDAGKFYLGSSSATLARAEIQDRTARLTARAGGRILEMQLIGTPEQEAAGSVAIQLSLEIDNKGFLDLLYAVESGLPLFDVISLSVQKHDGQTGLGDDTLHVEMAVRGHWRKATG